MPSLYLDPACRVVLWIVCFLAGTAAHFAPQVHWSCSSSTVAVFVQSSSPFEGLISTKEATTSECRSVGAGSHVAVLRLALKNNHCGVRYDYELDQYVVTVEIHSHSIVIVDEDVVFNVTCSGNRKTSSQLPLRDEMTLSVREIESGRIVREVIHENQYLLAIASTSNAQDFRVANCTAQNGLNPPIELTDSRGCSLYPSLFTHFKRAANGWYATISSMFRFPLSTNITFSCQVLRCQGECVVHSCIERNSVIRRSGSELITLTESLHTTVLLRHSPEATTTMQAYEQTTQPSNACEMSGDGDGTVMCTLCILLSVCSLLGFAFEVVLYILLTKMKYIRDSDGNKSNTQIGDELRLSDPRNQESVCPDNRRDSSISDSSIMRTNSPNRVSILMEYSRASGRRSDFKSVFCCTEINPTSSFQTPNVMHTAGENQAVSYL